MIFGCTKKLKTRVEFIKMAHYTGHLNAFMNFQKKRVFEFDYLVAIQNIWIHRKEVPNQAHSGIVFYDYKSAK